jgi:hypothetical protein
MSPREQSTISTILGKMCRSSKLRTGVIDPTFSLPKKTKRNP